MPTPPLALQFSFQASDCIAGQSLVNGQYTLAMQTDGNFVLYAGNQSLWQSHTYNNPNAWAVMQADGNLVVYSPGPTNVHALWQSGTYNQPGDRLVVQPDGNAVISNSNAPVRGGPQIPRIPGIISGSS